MSLLEFSVCETLADPWVKLTGIATFVAAMVALIVGLVPAWLAFWARRRLRKVIALRLAHELFTASFLMDGANALLLPGAISPRAFNEALEMYGSVTLPLVERYLDKLDSFTTRTASAVVNAHAKLTLARQTDHGSGRLTDPLGPVDERLRAPLADKTNHLARVLKQAHDFVADAAHLPAMTPDYVDGLEKLVANFRPDLAEKSALKSGSHV